MQITYTVNSVSQEPFSARATYEGKEIDVSVGGLVVELVNERMSTTLRFIPDAMADAMDLFPVGKTVIATFKPGAGK